MNQRKEFQFSFGLFEYSQHFKALMDVPEQPIRHGGNNTEADRMIID